jgi:uncharacterized cupredoxin-like copper-binding protein
VARIVALILTLAALATAAGCGRTSSSAAPTTTGDEAGEEEVEGAQTLNVRLDEWRIQVEQRALFAGKVAFLITNGGREAHELVVLRTDLPAAALPVHGSRVGAGDGWTIVGEVEQIPPGRSEAAVFDLPRGHYVLICDFPNHYARGMHADLEVH